MDVSLVELILELKEDIGNVASDLNRLNDKLDVHAGRSKATAEKVDQLEKDAARLKGALAAFMAIGTVVAVLRTLFN